MEQKDFADILNSMKDLTIGQIFKLITKIKYKVLVSFITFALAVVGGAFAAGKYSHQKETAVMLQTPFSMRIQVQGEPYDFENLTLVKDPTLPPIDDGKIILSLREIRGSFDIIPVGKVIATVEEDKLTGIWKVIISKSSISSIAHAYDKVAFDWRGHENDYNFKEKFVSKSTVHRYYSDGCILAYDVDQNRRSVPGSFRWIKTAH